MPILKFSLKRSSASTIGTGAHGATVAQGEAARAVTVGGPWAWAGCVGAFAAIVGGGSASEGSANTDGEPRSI